jgi:hypothetical protein
LRRPETDGPKPSLLRFHVASTGIEMATGPTGVTDPGNSPRHIRFFTKAFEKACHADAFMDGRLRANRLCRFRKMENEDPRADDREGTITFQSDNTPKVVLIPHNAPENAIEIHGPGSMRVSTVDDLNVLCMYAGLFHPDDKRDMSADARRRRLAVPEVYSKFGAHAVLVHDPGEFIRRFTTYTRGSHYSYWRRAVQYYDPDVFDINDLSEQIDIAFHKSNAYAAEREYRFAVDTNTTGPDAITLDIGPIHDIAIRVNTADLNQVIFPRCDKRQ